MTSISETFHKLLPNACSPFVLHPEATSTVDSIKSIPFHAVKSGQYSLSAPWYSYLAATHNAISHPCFSIVRETIEHYVSFDDNQFPPDYLKAVRLYSLLESVSPTHIIEFGSGSSTAIISSYCKSNTSRPIPITLEASQQWLDTTKSKISPLYLSTDHFFYASTSSHDIEGQLKKYLKPESKLFVYVDAKIIDNDKLQGLQLLLNLSSLLPSRLCLLIDSRSKAVLNLHELSAAISTPLIVQTSFNHLGSDRITWKTATSSTLKLTNALQTACERAFNTMTATTFAATPLLLKSISS